MTITYQQIAQRAYEIWEREGKPKGQDQDHWLQAEEELRSEALKKQKGRKITSRDPAMLKTPKGEEI